MSSSQPIQLSEICAYFIIFPTSIKETYTKYIIALDAVFLKHQYDESESKSKSSKNK